MIKPYTVCNKLWPWLFVDFGSRDIMGLGVKSMGESLLELAKNGTTGLRTQIRTGGVVPPCLGTVSWGVVAGLR